MDPQDVYQVRHAPAFGDPPHPGGLQHFPQLRSSVKQGLRMKFCLGFA